MHHPHKHTAGHIVLLTFWTICPKIASPEGVGTNKKETRGTKMDEKILPIRITTYEAFKACMDCDVKAVYIYKEVFWGRPEEIFQILEEHGYELPGLPTRYGAVFVKGLPTEQCMLQSFDFY